MDAFFFVSPIPRFCRRGLLILIRLTGKCFPRRERRKEDTWNLSCLVYIHYMRAMTIRVRQKIAAPSFNLDDDIY